MAIKRKSGFTLVEMLVTIGVFAIVSMVSSAIFINVNNLQQQTGNLQRLQNESRYLLEKIAREIRGRELDYEAINFSAGGLTGGLVFKKDEYGEILSLEHDSANKDCLIAIDSGSGSLAEKLNSAEASVEKLLFKIVPMENPYGSTATSSPLVQPKVTVFMKVKNRGVPERYIKELNLQTTISSKIYKQ